MKRRVFVAGSVVTVVKVGCGGSASDSDTGGGSEGSEGASTDAESSDVGGETGGATGSGTGGASGTGDTGGFTGPGGGTSASGDAGTGTGDGSTGEPACPPTASDIEGPFYREGIPVGGDLDVHGDPGLPLILTGTVQDGDCTPLEGAVVELWHATPRAPEGEPGDFDAVYDATDTYRYYGQVATGDDGAYRFNTLMPGWYLNGAEYRPAHLHVKVWVANELRLTTQLYFADDPFNASDNWYNPDNELAPDGNGEASYDFFV